MLVSVKGNAYFSRGRAYPVIAHTFLMSHPTALRFANWLPRLPAIARGAGQNDSSVPLAQVIEELRHKLVNVVV
jgi:hypothetical protein